MSELRVGIAGLGQMGGYHLRTWTEIDGAVVAAVADPDLGRALQASAGRGVSLYADHRAMLEEQQLDAVCICAPSEHHASMALDAIDAGLHVFVEKPIAMTLEDGLRVAARARQAGVKLMVGHVERFNPAVTKLAELVSAGRIGRVFRAHATRVGPLPERIRNAGVALDLATHDLDLMQIVLGRDITHVYAEGTSFAHPSHEDMLSCLLRFGEDGPYGLLDVNWLTPEKRREMTVIGEDGMLRAEYLTQSVWLTEPAGSASGWADMDRLQGGAEGREVRLALHKVEPLRAELEAFARCVALDEPEPVSARDGCRALAAALAMRDSAECGRRVRLLDMPAPRAVTAIGAEG